MGRLLAADRMTDAQLWTTLHRCLYDLAYAQLGTLTLTERRGLAVRAMECVDELHLRGNQLRMGDTP